MNEHTIDRNKHYPRNPVKKSFHNSHNTLVIDERILSELGITKDDNTCVEQILNDLEIKLKIKKNIEEVG